MALSRITNTFSEYAFDDFDETKNYHRVLYKPGVSVQARELTQMQTNLQRQIDYQGQYSFVDGARVTGANLSIDIDYDYIKVEDVFVSAGTAYTTSSYLADLKGCTIVSSTGHEARVVQVITSAGVDANDTTKTGILDNNSGDAITLYVKYTKSSATVDADVAGTTKFSAGEVLTTTTAPAGAGSTTRKVRVGGLTAGNATSAEYVGTTPGGNNADGASAITEMIGKGSIAYIEEGSYFISGTFVYVADQSLILEKYSGTPTTLIGLNVVESVVGSISDNTLLDNATGYPNASAPGADRYKISVTLVKTASSNSIYANFIQLSSLTLGIPQSNSESIVQKTSTEFDNKLARRTFEESGNYTLRPFSFDIREHLDDGEGNGGIYPASGGRIDGSAGHIAFGIQPNIAYLQGRRFEHIAPEYLKIIKTRDAAHQESTEQLNINLPLGNYFKAALSSVDGMPNVNTHTVATLQHAAGDDGICHFGSMTNPTVSGRTERSILVTEGVTAGVTVTAGTNGSGLELRLTTDSAGSTTVEVTKAGTGYAADTQITITNNAAALGGSTATSMVLSGAVLGMGTCRIRDLAFHDSSNVRLYAYDIKINGTETNETLLSDVTLINQVDAGGGTTAENAFKATVDGNLYDTGSNQLVYPLPVSGVKDVAAGSVKPEYLVRKKFSGDKTGTEITFDIEDDEKFIFDGHCYISRAGAAPILASAAEAVYDASNNHIKVTLSSASENIQLIATIERSGTSSVRKNKAHVFQTEKTIAYDGSNNVLLGKADIKKVLSIYDGAKRVSLAVHASAVGTVGAYTIQMAAVDTTAIRAGMVVSLADASLASAGASAPKIFGLVESVDTTNDIITLQEALTEVPANGATLTFDTNIASQFSLDNGQRPNFYQEGALVPLSSLPAGSIIVKYTYYNHSAGDYFVADSYPSAYYDEIGVFQSFAGTLELRDSIDFRPIKASSGDVLLGSEFFTGDAPSSELPTMIKPNSNIILDLNYYLGRVDKIILDKGGNYKVVSGLPAAVPVAPDDIADSMTIATLELGPYMPTLAGFFDVEAFNYKRYTMEDIGSIESRVDSLEYYTSLNLLENQTSNEHMEDSGSQRFKNGMFVDTFSGHQNGDVNHPDYLIAVDKEAGKIRPHTAVESVEMGRATNDAPTGGVGTAVSSDGAFGSRIVNTNGIYTLPYTYESLIKQSYASTIIPVNPYNIFSWAGTLELSPSSDFWRETRQRPDIVRDNEGVYNTLLSKIHAENTIGTVWNNWETDWVGARQGGTGNVFKRHVKGIINAKQSQSWVNMGSVRQRQTRAQLTAAGRRWGLLEHTTWRRATDIRQGQSRTGINKTIRISTRREVISNKVVSTSFIPFMRSRIVAFNAQLMKPNTKVYPFFDDINVSAYCRKAGGSGFVRWSSRTDRARIFGRRRSLWYTFPSTGVFSNQAAGDLVTNAAGQLSGYFLIPNNSKLRFKTGTHTFRLSDSAKNDEDTETTFSQANYTATGVIDHKQRNILSTRIPSVVTREVSNNRITERRIVETRTTTKWVDPLAQTFLIDQPGGVFLGQIKIYVANEDSTIPLNVSIREVENGIPTQKVVPGTDLVVYPGSIATSNNGSLATTLNFDYPVYLSEDTEYAIVLISQSDAYSVWIAEQGQKDVLNPTHRINKQPYNGVFFTSQNASTWTPEQNKDLKFELLRCKFAINGETNMDDAACTANFVNLDMPYDELPENPFTYLTANIVRVNHPNHGMQCGPQTGATQNGLMNKVVFTGYPSGENGLTSSVINAPAGFYVHDIEHDSYCFTHTGTATTHGGSVGGGSDITALDQLQYNSIYVKNEVLEIPDTSLSAVLEGRTGKSIDGADVISGQNMNYSKLTNMPVMINSTNEIGIPMVVANAINEAAMQNTSNQIPNGSASTFGSKSLAVSVKFTSNSNFLSPIIDDDRSGIFAISNRTNDASAYQQYKPDGTTANFYYNNSGNKITSTSSTQDSYYNNTTDGRNFKANTGTGGTSDINSYITKTVTLNDPASVLRVMANVSKPTDSDIYLYYKALSNDQSDLDFDTIDWTYATPDGGQIEEDDLGPVDVEWNITPTQSFTFFVFKIVLVSKNSSNVPEVGAFRAIAAT
jgi:hypothetical protein